MGSRINKINIGNTDYELEDIRVTFTDDGKISSSVLPSYVDDVLEYNNKSSFPSTGETGKIYVDKSTNLTYRWGGSSYVEISPSIALGEVENTAYPGNLGQANAHDIAAILDGHSVVAKAESDGNGNNIVNTYLKKTDASSTYLSKTDASSTYLTQTNASNTYATKTALNTTNSNVTTLQGYFSSGIAKKATADKNGKDITTEYVHTKVDGGTSSDQMFSQIKHMTDESSASVFISADNMSTYYGGLVKVTTNYVQLYYGDGTQEGCRFELTQTGATLEFNDSGTKYSIITTENTATANNVGVIKAAAVRTSAITATTGKTTTTGYYGVELDSNNKAFVAIPWSAIPTSLVPSDNGSYNLGSSSYKWSYIYANYLGSSSYKISTAYITNIGSSSYKTNYVYANYIGAASYPCTAVYTNKLQFAASNYITNMASGSFNITMANGTVGTENSYSLTIPNYSTGSGTWHVFATVTGAYCNTAFVGVNGEVTNGGCKIYVRNGYASASRTIKIHWLAVRY